MILLTSENDKLQLYLSNSNIPVEVQINYVDLNLQTRLQTPGRLNLTIQTGGSTNIISGSDQYGVSRAIKQMSIYNADPVQPINVKIRHSAIHNNETSPRVATQYATGLPAGFSIQYTTGQGYYNQGQFDQGLSVTDLRSDGNVVPGEFAIFTDANTVTGISEDELKEILDITGIEQDESGDFIFNGNIIFAPSTVPYIVDLGGGSITNGTIDGGSVDITP